MKRVSHVCQSLVVYTSTSAVSLVYNWLSSDINLLFVAISKLSYVLYLDGISDTVVQVSSSTLSSLYNLPNLYIYIYLVVLHNHI